MQRRFGLALAAAWVTASLLAAGGCNSSAEFLTEERLNRGLVVILPGIEGQSDLNRSIRTGLGAGGVYRAMPIHSWGRPVPLAGLVLNQMDFLGNRLAGIGVANMIRSYQDSHPGKPVHIVGHSGGGGVAVFAAEALSEERKIDGLILLSASISSAYDLSKAAKRCRNGIVNFYNPDDAGLLGLGTIVVGTVDGTHGPSAGLIGFDKAGQKGHENVYQVKLGGMDSEDDPHTSTTRVGFVSVHVAPWVLAESWPPGTGLARPPAPDRPPPEPTTQAGGKPTTQPGGKPTTTTAPADRKAAEEAPTSRPKDEPKADSKPRAKGRRKPRRKPKPQAEDE